MSSNSHFLLNGLAASLGGTISNIEGDRILQCHTQESKIYGTSVDLGSGISFSQYQLNLSDPISLKFNAKGKSSIFFLYCTDGTIKYQLGPNGPEENEVLELQTAIIGAEDQILNIHIPGDKTIGFSLIEVQYSKKKSKSAGDNDMDDEVLATKVFDYFTVNNRVKDIKFYSTLNLNIKTQLDTIENIQNRGIVRKLMIKGLVQYILALQILNFSEDIKNELFLDSNLSTDELIRVREALHEITTHPQYNYSIELLCKKYLLSARKLQEGFKMLTGKTVSLYILDQRLILAEKLIKKGDITISEIVYKIGFSSRSYFSRIFKNKFGCSPSYYLKNFSNAT